MNDTSKIDLTWDREFDKAMQELYEEGYFEPRGIKKDVSGLEIEFLIPPERNYSYDP